MSPPSHASPDPSAAAAARWLATPCDFVLTWGATSDVGLVRQNNEDALRLEPAADLALLADGMGGYNAGEVASRLAVDCAGQELLAILDRSRQHPAAQAGADAPSGSEDEVLQNIYRTLEQAQQCAHQRVLSQARSHPGQHGMGTTLVGLWLRGEQAFVTHVGDSRVYRWRPMPTRNQPGWGELDQITRDHTLLQEQIDAGFLALNASIHPGARNVLTRALGIAGAFSPETRSLKVRPGDLFLMCSDGLNDALHDSQIATLCAQAGHDIQALTERLVEAANTQGGRDNVTVVALRVGAPRAAAAHSGR